MKTTRTTPRREGPKAPRIKAERTEDTRHLAQVRSLPCVACGAWPVEAHHIRIGTMGRKASDLETLPLCPRHHNEQHPDSYSIHRNPDEFTRIYGTERELLAKTLKALGEAE